MLGVGDGISFAVGMAFASQAAILPLFVAHFTRAEWVIGLIPAISLLGMQATQVVGAAYRARLNQFWGPFKVLLLLPRLALFAMALTPFLPGQAALWGFFACYGAFALAIGFQVPAWFEYVSHLVRAERRGRFFGYRHALGGLASLLASGLAAGFLAWLPFPYSFAACFTLAAVAVYAGYLMQIAVRFDWSAVDRRNRDTAPFWPSAMGMIRENKDFRAYIFLRFALTAGSMALAFYIVHAMDRFDLTNARSSLLVIGLVHGPALGGVLWGHLADRVGCKRVLAFGSVLAAASTVVLVTAPSLPVYVAGLFGIGCGNVIVMIIDGKWLLQIDDARQNAVVSFFSLAMSPASVGLPILAGILASRLGIPALFWVTGAAWLAGAVYLAAFVRDPGQPGHPGSRTGKALPASR